MPTPSEFLRRFRLMAVPGPAAIAAVPSDRSEALRKELEPVFAALRDVNEGTAATVALAQAEGRLTEPVQPRKHPRSSPRRAV